MARDERVRQNSELDVATSALGEASLRTAALQKVSLLVQGIIMREAPLYGAGSRGVFQK